MLQPTGSNKQQQAVCSLSIEKMASPYIQRIAEDSMVWYSIALSSHLQEKALQIQPLFVRHIFYSVVAMQSWHIRKISKLERLFIVLFHHCLLMAALSQVYLSTEMKPNHKNYYSFRWVDFSRGEVL